MNDPTLVVLTLLLGALALLYVRGCAALLGPGLRRVLQRGGQDGLVKLFDFRQGQGRGRFLRQGVKPEGKKEDGG